MSRLAGTRLKAKKRIGGALQIIYRWRLRCTRNAALPSPWIVAITARRGIKLWPRQLGTLTSGTNRVCDSVFHRSIRTTDSAIRSPVAQRWARIELSEIAIINNYLLEATMARAMLFGVMGSRVYGVSPRAISEGKW